MTSLRISLPETNATLSGAVDSIPAGAWAVGVSGGADSVALLELLRQRSDLALHIVHLDHETRGDESSCDASFVRELATKWGMPCTVARRSEVEPSMADLPRNASAKFRALRLQLFRRVIEAHAFAGVILAHHADDQAETVFQRLLRGSGPSGLTGMRSRTVIGGVAMLRPLLGVRREALRTMLRDRGIAWREDSSNQSTLQQRNRVRGVLRDRPEMVEPFLNLAVACASLNDWVREQGVVLEMTFETTALLRLPPPLAREAARQWLARQVRPRAEITAAATERLMEMAQDAASPSRQHFPGGVLVRRRGGKISADSSSCHGDAP
jgi:tRNA(Ile)-lysidine synthase